MVDQQRSVPFNEPPGTGCESVVAPITAFAHLVAPNQVLFPRSSAVHPVNAGTNFFHSDVHGFEQPPIQPPRSASTLGPHRLHQDQLLAEEFHQAATINQANLAHPYLFADPRQYLFYDPRLQCYIAAPVLTTDMYPSSGMTVMSSLSRNDPTRAHVIPPNHRRLPPFHAPARPSFVPGEQPTVVYREFNVLSFILFAIFC